MPSHAPTIAKWFRIPYPYSPSPCRPLSPSPLPPPGQILLITGPSGSGKSSLLHSIHDESTRNNQLTLDLSSLSLPPRPTIDVPGLPLDASLQLLSLVGLAEAHTYLLPPHLLSDGQVWRLRLAAALARAAVGPRRRTLLVADEFAALLDRVTAMALSRALRRVSRRPEYGHLSIALATSHEDLVIPLEPDTLIRCDFGSYAIRGSNNAGWGKSLRGGGDGWACGPTAKRLLRDRSEDAQRVALRLPGVGCEATAKRGGGDGLESCKGLSG